MTLRRYYLDSSNYALFRKKTPLKSSRESLTITIVTIKYRFDLVSRKSAIKDFGHFARFRPYLISEVK